MASQLNNINFYLKTSNFTSKSHPLTFPPPNSSAHLNLVQNNSKFKFSASVQETPTNKEKLGVVVKPMERPRIVLKLIRMQKTIGVGLDQVVPAIGTIPLTPYYFWRKENAQDQLKLLLQSKPWISHRQMHILLNQATHIFKLWPDSG